MVYFRILLFLHVLGAAVGFGPTAAFGLLHNVGKKASGPGRRAVMEGIYAVSTKMATPFDVIQPITGVLLIFYLGLNRTLFSQEWLWISIILYVLMMNLVHGRAMPALVKILEIERKDDFDNPALTGLHGRFAKTEMVLGLLFISILILMVTKPGGPVHL